MPIIHGFFSIIDLPVIISGDYCGYFEPQESVWNGESGMRYTLQKLKNACPEALLPYDGVEEFTVQSYSFLNKTLFRFPLRCKPSKLSKEMYSIKELKELFKILKAEAKYVLLFLRSVRSIEVIEISEFSTETIFEVSVSIHNPLKHISQQQLPLAEQAEAMFKGTFDGKIIQETFPFQVHLTDGETLKKHEWIVVHRVGSEDPEVLALAEEQCVLPWVGTAFEIGENSGGRIFCFLPLPLEDRAPFNVHVHGTFAVSSNRRSLNWESQERQNDPEATWNKYLVEKCIPESYARLVEEITKIPAISPEIVYNCWPVISRVRGTPWEGSLKLLFEKMLYSERVVHTAADGGKWISITSSVFVPKGENLPACIEHALICSGTKVVKISLQQWNVMEMYYDREIQKITPSLVRQILKQNPDSYKYQSDDNKHIILQYCISDKKYSDLAGLELIPLANGSFGTFQIMNRYYSHFFSEIYVCTNAIRHDLLPGLDDKMVDLLADDPVTHSLLTEVSKTEATQLRLLNEHQVVKLLQLSNPQKWSQIQLKKFWQWLQRYSLKIFLNANIMPVKDTRGEITVHSLSKQSNIIYVPHYQSLQRSLREALEKFGIKFACMSDFPYLSHQEMQSCVYHFEVGNVIDALPDTYPYLIRSVQLSGDESLAIQRFLSGGSTTLTSKARLTKICEMRIFSVIQCNDTRYSLNLVISHRTSNKALVQGRGFCFRTDLLPKQFLIISDGQDLLTKLPAMVIIISGTECLEKLVFPLINSGHYTNSEISAIMTSVLDNLQDLIRISSRASFCKCISSLPFVTVQTGQRKAPSSLFDPHIKQLVELYKGEPVFPSGVFSNYVDQLRTCGLMGCGSVTAHMMYELIQNIQPQMSKACLRTGCSNVTFTRLVAFFSFLVSYPKLLNCSVTFDSSLLFPSQQSLANAVSQYARSHTILPVASKKPSNYPSCLTWKGSLSKMSLAKFTSREVILLQNCIDHNSSNSPDPMIIGSEVIFIENIPIKICQLLHNSRDELGAAVAKHFKHVIEHEEDIDDVTLEYIAHKTYEFLGCCSQNVTALTSVHKWIWVESCSRFVRPGLCALSSNPSYFSSLEPFVYVLPKKMKKYENLLSTFGVKKTITEQQILSVLSSIRNRTEIVTDHSSWSMVKNVLEWIAASESEFDNVLVPIECEGTYPELHPIEEVSYTDNKLLLEIAEFSDHDYKLVHPRIAHLAPQLGLTPLSDQLDITEEVFQDAGQHEPLTTRLSNILKEYKDGLTIVKEMIQNADDAKATEVNILYDARHHTTTTDKLIFKEMAKSHGPALVVHNNAAFTEEDFINITKLAGATKKDKPLKIGKFGVGFCSVYHITDVPSFVSGEWLYIFDPTLTHLKGIIKNENQPGKKVKYMSKVLSHTQQLVPYEGLFGFNALDEYNETMFRFPFRKCASQISSTVYNESMVNELKEEIIQYGKNTLLFLSNVRKITFQSIRNEDVFPIEEVTITKTNLSDQLVKLETTVKNQVHQAQEEFWLISCEEENIYHVYENKFQLGTASVACQLCSVFEQYKVIPINGSVFCYLPLPVPSTGLPVHVSANFAVMSNRSGIWTSASSTTPSDAREWWNQTLMETVIPAAYCKILKLLKSLFEKGELLEYNFYALLPLTEALLVKNPWTTMIEHLYGNFFPESLFYSESSEEWLTLESCEFLSPNILNANLTIVPQCVIDIINILKLSVVYLPQQYLSQLELYSKNSLPILHQEEFCTLFFSKIKSFSCNFELRNDVLLKMFITAASEVTIHGSSELVYILKSNPCVPCMPRGENIKLASNVVNPISELSELFDKDSEMFPIKCFTDKRPVYQTMSDIGLLTTCLPWHLILECANSIQSVYEKDRLKALKRVVILISCIKKNIDCKSHNTSVTSSWKVLHSRTTKNVYSSYISQIGNVKFIPVVGRPDKYFLKWKGEGMIFSSPSDMFYPNPTSAYGFYEQHQSIKRECFLLGTQKIIVNSLPLDKGGCGVVPETVLKTLGFQTKPSVDEVLENFQCLIRAFDSILLDQQQLEHVEYICQKTYEFLNNELGRTSLSKYSKVKSNQKDLNKAEKRISSFKDKLFIWTGECFILPENVALKWREKGPYLYELPPILSERKNLIRVLEIKEKFSVAKLLMTLEEIQIEYGCSVLPAETHITIDAIVSELNSYQVDDFKNVQETDVVLPNDSYALFSGNDLSLNDSPWLPVEEDCVLVHTKLNRNIAIALGVNAIRSKFLDEYVSHGSIFGGSPFGQREELTQRIKNILRDYPFDVTFIKELLQNADDGKATKMSLIIDKRTHSKQKIPSKEWEELQGPAVLVWNNKDFTEEDLKGIQKLGVGSKRDDSESIGQFGIGFNVVYHITDCPSFITRGNTLCVFDPHCRYVPGTTPLSPGIRYDNMEDKFWTGMSDLKSAYLLNDKNEIWPPGSEGSLFRFPLRQTVAQVLQSEIVDNEYDTLPLTIADIEVKFNEWVQHIKDALLFLNHITEFSYYIIDETGYHLQAKYEVILETDAIHKRKELFRAFANFKASKKPDAFTYQLSLNYREKKCMLPLQVRVKLESEYQTFQEKWLIQQGVGDLDKNESSQKWLYVNRVLPKHGIAAQCTTSSFTGRIFCFLPLPVLSNLPVHINGQFVLSSNRRSLWDGEDHAEDKKKEWNNKLIEAVASSYVHFLIEARRHFVKGKDYTDRQKLYVAMNQYYRLYPFWTSIKQNFKGHDQKSLILDRNCLKLAQLVFMKLWAANPEILAVEIFTKCETSDSKLVRVEWNPLQNEEDPMGQAYFHPVCENKKAIISLLKSIKLKLTSAPHMLYEHLCTNQTKPVIATPESVFKYYCCFYKHIFINDIPCSIEHSPFKSTERFCQFIGYLLKTIPESDQVEKVFPEPPYGYPLVLTADGMVRCFKKNAPVIRTIFYELFPNSLDYFLHAECLTARMSSSYFLHSGNVSFQLIEFLLEKNYPLELKQEQCDNSNNCLIESDVLNKLWESFLSENDHLTSKHEKQIVNHWALIPANDKNLYSACSKILPINTVGSENIEEAALKVLLHLGLPKFDHFILRTASVKASKYCPKMTDYNQVLCIIFHLQQQSKIFDNLSPDTLEARLILSYLARTDYLHDQALKDKIKALPLFKSIDGKLRCLSGKKVYLWPQDDFCYAGYNKWASSSSVIFLERHGDWRYLTKSSSFDPIGSNLSSIDVYMELIFPIFCFLTPEERESHLLYIRDHVYPKVKHDSEYIGTTDSSSKDFIEKLKALPCIECPDTNQPRAVKDFCDHNVPIFTCFPDSFLFLSKVYHEERWMDFFRSLGLKNKVTVGEFVEFCSIVSKGEHRNLKGASRTLLRYLFKEGTQWPEHDLKCIGDISFVLVADPSSLRWIKEPCSPPQWVEKPGVGLTKLNQAVLFESANLIWTVKPLVKVPAVSNIFHDREAFLGKLQLTIAPSAVDVIENLINISKSGLSKFSLFFQYDPQYISSSKPSANQPDRTHILDVIISCMNFLQVNIKACKTTVKRLADYSCIPVSADRSSHELKPMQIVLVKPIQVVKHFTSEDRFLVPFINEIPTCLEPNYSLLQQIGVMDSVELPHLQYVLEVLHTKLEACSADPNQVQTIRCVITKLGQLISKESYNKQNASQRLHPLYLPTLTGDYWNLKESSRLVFADSERYKMKELKKFNFVNAPYSLFQIPPDNTLKQEQVFRSQHILFQPSDDAMSSYNEMKLCFHLPKEVRPKHLSLRAHEIRLLVGDVSEEKTLVSLNLASLHKFLEPLKDLLPSILKHHAHDSLSAMSGEFVVKFISLFDNLKTIIISGLQASVCIDKHVVGTLTSPSFVLERGKNGCYTLFLADSAKPESKFWTELSYSVLLEIAKVIQCSDPTELLSLIEPIGECLQIHSASSLQLLCKKYSVEFELTDHNEIEEEDVENLLAPVPGKKIPDEFIDRLDNSIHNIFRPEEWVGYEVSEHNFVWAYILYPEDCLGTTEANLENATKKYRIFINKDDENGKVVSALDLYKIIPEDMVKLSESKELVPVEETRQTTGMRKAREALSVKEMKRKICEELKLIWTLSDDEKRKAMKRMYLKYHPDKAPPDEQDLYDELFKFLNRQIDRLEKGLDLEDPDQDSKCESAKDSYTYNSSHSWTSFFTHWNGYVPRNPRRSRGSFGGVGGSYRDWRNQFQGGSRFNFEQYQSRPSPQEATRWLRQAQADCNALRVLRKEMHRSVQLACHVILMAYEVVEKSLKAGMYAVIGLNPNSPKKRDLHYCAQSICSQRPAGHSLSKTRGGNISLVTIASEMSPYFLKSRYPSEHQHYYAPVDVYSPTEAEEAADYAEITIAFINKIV